MAGCGEILEWKTPKRFLKDTCRATASSKVLVCMAFTSIVFQSIGVHRVHRVHRLHGYWRSPEFTGGRYWYCLGLVRGLQSSSLRVWNPESLSHGLTFNIGFLTPCYTAHYDTPAAKASSPNMFGQEATGESVRLQVRVSEWRGVP